MVALGGIINLITCSIAGTTRSTFFVGRTGWQEEPEREGRCFGSVNGRNSRRLTNLCKMPSALGDACGLICKNIQN